MSSALPLRSWRRASPGAEAGATLFEYILLVAVVALISGGALIYFGRISASPARQLKRVGSAVTLGVNPPSGPARQTGYWCTSNESRCRMVLSAGGYDWINFSVSGGDGSYSYLLKSASGPEVPSAGFVTLYSDHNKIEVGPASCPDGSGPSYTYAPLTLLVRDGASPPNTGRLTFSITVKPC